MSSMEWTWNGQWNDWEEMIEGSNQRVGQTALIMPRTYSSTRLATALRAASLKAGYTPCAFGP
jgi:hypothetical protein